MLATDLAVLSRVLRSAPPVHARGPLSFEGSPADLRARVASFGQSRRHAVSGELGAGLFGSGEARSAVLYVDSVVAWTRGLGLKVSGSGLSIDIRPLANEAVVVVETDLGPTWAVRPGLMLLDLARTGREEHVDSFVYKILQTESSWRCNLTAESRAAVAIAADALIEATGVATLVGSQAVHLRAPRLLTVPFRTTDCDFLVTELDDLAAISDSLGRHGFTQIPGRPGSWRSESAIPLDLVTATYLHADDTRCAYRPGLTLCAEGGVQSRVASKVGAPATAGLVIPDPSHLLVAKLHKFNDRISHPSAAPPHKDAYDVYRLLAGDGGLGDLASGLRAALVSHARSEAERALQVLERDYTSETSRGARLISELEQDYTAMAAGGRRASRRVRRLLAML